MNARDDYPILADVSSKTYSYWMYQSPIAKALDEIDRLRAGLPIPSLDEERERRATANIGADLREWMLKHNMTHPALRSAVNRLEELSAYSSPVRE